jgi:UDP-N-acetylmuramate: L-alanyl-gamma-D-glutamyl-meso-diaminopimelate ligase
VHPQGEPAVDAVLDMGVWTPTQATGAGGDWSAEWLHDDASAFRVQAPDGGVAEVRWGQTGAHNVQNALSAMAAAAHVGIAPARSAAALGRFAGVKRRMELRGEVGGVRVYDDFAHHPTAIASTLHGLRRRVGDARIIAVLEPRSNTMRLGVHAAALADSLAAADQVQVYAPPDLDWDAAAMLAPLGERLRVGRSVQEIVAAVGAEARAGDQVLVMSNGGFGGIHALLLEALSARA